MHKDPACSERKQRIAMMSRHCLPALLQVVSHTTEYLQVDSETIFLCAGSPK